MYTTSIYSSPADRTSRVIGHSALLMEWLQALGIAGFLFFLIKGLLWLLVLALVSRGVIRKRSLLKTRVRLRRLLR